MAPIPALAARLADELVGRLGFDPADPAFGSWRTASIDAAVDAAVLALITEAGSDRAAIYAARSDRPGEWWSLPDYLIAMAALPEHEEAPKGRAPERCGMSTGRRHRCQRYRPRSGTVRGETAVELRPAVEGAPAPGEGRDGRISGGDDVLGRFAAYQRQRGFSERTVKRRETTVRSFARFLAPKGLAAAELLDIDQFLSTKPAARTRHAYRSDLRVFYAWAVKRNLFESNPAADVESVKIPKALPRPLGPEATDLLDHGRKQTRQMVALALYAGLRDAEIAALRAEDVWLHEKPPVVVVRDGKGGKDRVVPLHPAVIELLGQLPGEGPVFPGRQGATLRPATVSARIKRHLRASGVEARPHQLRHTFGTELARCSGGDVVLVAELMGHASTDTTMGYVRLATGRGAAEVHRLFGP
jgi:site-specific recombinase XerD